MRAPRTGGMRRNEGAPGWGHRPSLARIIPHSHPRSGTARREGAKPAPRLPPASAPPGGEPHRRLLPEQKLCVSNGNRAARQLPPPPPPPPPQLARAERLPREGTSGVQRIKHAFTAALGGELQGCETWGHEPQPHDGAPPGRRAAGPPLPPSPPPTPRLPAPTPPFPGSFLPNPRPRRAPREGGGIAAEPGRPAGSSGGGGGGRGLCPPRPGRSNVRHGLGRAHSFSAARPTPRLRA